MSCFISLELRIASGSSDKMWMVTTNDFQNKSAQEFCWSLLYRNVSVLVVVCMCVRVCACVFKCMYRNFR
jgi:hypothetical protein